MVVAGARRTQPVQLSRRAHGSAGVRVITQRFPPRYAPGLLSRPDCSANDFAALLSAPIAARAPWLCKRARSWTAARRCALRSVPQRTSRAARRKRPRALIRCALRCTAYGKVRAASDERTPRIAASAILEARER